MDGHTDYVAFNHVRLGAPTSRSAGMVAPVWIIDPQEGTSVADGARQDQRPQHRPGRQARWEILQGRRDNGDKTAYLNGNATASADAGAVRACSACPSTSARATTRSGCPRSTRQTATEELNVDTRGFTVKR